MHGLIEPLPHPTTQRWRWRVFFFPGTIPPLPAIHEGQAVRSPPRAQGGAHRGRPHQHQQQAWDDHDLEWAGRGYGGGGVEEDTTVLADAEVASYFSGRYSEGRGRRGMQYQYQQQARRPRHTRSAPPVSSGSEGEEDEEEAMRRLRRQQRRERRRWEYYR